jgi:hypothetical protein
MGCGCKNNQPQQKVQPIMVQQDNVIHIVELSEPPYTRQDVIRMKDYLSSMNKVYAEKSFISNLLLTNFGDIIPDYCDQTCLNHIKTRSEYMESKLLEYENFIKK